MCNPESKSNVDGEHCMASWLQATASHTQRVGVDDRTGSRHSYFNLPELSVRAEENKRLLLYAENRILSGLADTKFHYGLCRNPDLLLRFRIQTDTRLPLLFH